jgi:hypothetical protein
VDQNTTTSCQRIFDKLDNSWKMLDEVLIVHIVDLDVAVRVVLPSFRLSVVKPQRGDDMCYARIFERLRPPEGKYSWSGQQMFHRSGPMYMNTRADRVKRGKEYGIAT